jgi:HEAT repeat protein
MTTFFVALLSAQAACRAGDPYQEQLAEHLLELQATDAAERAGAAEAIGFLRAYDAAPQLVRLLRDPASVVRREAALSLAWCGDRKSIDALLDGLDDPDWSVRQGAAVALGNLTGMRWPYDGLADSDTRHAQAARWRAWWATNRDVELPEDVSGLLAHPGAATANLARGCEVSASSTYKGPLSTLTDGLDEPGFWQTKAVAFPQSCTIDLGAVHQVGCVIVSQFDARFVMTDWAIETSADGLEFAQVCRGGESPVRLQASFTPHPARYVRVSSGASRNPSYPTTFREVEIYAEAPAHDNHRQVNRALRGVRALGALGGERAPALVIRLLQPYRDRRNLEPAEKRLVQAGLRALGRVRSPVSRGLLVDFLGVRQWARYAAEALGDYGDEDAARALLAAYPRYARSVERRKPELVPVDDQPGFEPADRMYETPFAIAAALARQPLAAPDVVRALRKLGPRFAANLPGDFDGAMLYEPEAAQLVTAWLLERAGLRHAAAEAALAALSGAPEDSLSADAAAMYAAARGGFGEIPHAAPWLPAFCLDAEYAPRLIALLEHPNGWLRINAAKALIFGKHRQAAPVLAGLLKRSLPEAAHGYYGKFQFKAASSGQDEYDDPSPRWREAFVRALGKLGHAKHVSLLDSILDSDANVLEVRHAAALALDAIGTPNALERLRPIARADAAHSIRNVAIEALARRGEVVTVQTPTPLNAPALTTGIAYSAAPAIVFIKGENVLPNQFQIDLWRQTYHTSDTGPTYRLGRNLYRLDPPYAAGRVVALTTFTDGYVADCEVSWDGKRIIFARRGGDADPWWHLYQIAADGSDLRQLTHGPYHDVQPAWLPDERIVFSSSRMGMRDEYHGYLATGLTVMNADASEVRSIGFNLGRDNEPAILPDGRIVFSRLDLFYSRLKTELTVQAVMPDGQNNVVLYGPERRDFWHQITKRSGERHWGENPPRHRVLRLTQPQPMADGRILCASTGGLVAIGPGRQHETLLPHDRDFALTSPFPLADGRILCSATRKHIDQQGRVDQQRLDLGLYILDSNTGELALIYNDPTSADFEARPLMARPRPPLLPESEEAHGRDYSCRLLCSSVRYSRLADVRQRGVLLRVIEGMPIVARHQTHRSNPGPAWKNHTGTHARVLGTLPLAADGSFFVEVPADRLIHLQVLDNDRQVLGNQQFWMYGRPGETRTCIGCHERPDTAPVLGSRPLATAVEPLRCLPDGTEFTYRGKVWQKGTLRDEAEDRTRTVRATNLLGRY